MRRTWSTPTTCLQPPLESVKALPEVGVEYLPGRGLRQTFPADPHYKLTKPTKFVWLSPLPADPIRPQVVISGQLRPSLHPNVQNMQLKVWRHNNKVDHQPPA
ncbi:hypothetical protein CHARACLAT_030280 [Characodon lateralis]|uniref:Uncharacterized protein n=1 Tax=Characodon lateralis TaxID=208331 RepID=A0ABU7EES7_9TELE|nr:hypothetical protein [Characodon lateralis]